MLFDTTHHHAEMLCLDDDADTPRLEHVVDRRRDLFRHPLLDLKASGKHVDNPGDFAKAYNLPGWKIGDMGFAVKRQHVVLAEAEKLDIFDDHHPVRFHFE